MTGQDKDKKRSDNKRNDKPDPPADLREEWQKEDIEIEGRKPDLEETEEDTSEL